MEEKHQAITISSIGVSTYSTFDLHSSGGSRGVNGSFHSIRRRHLLEFLGLSVIHQEEGACREASPNYCENYREIRQTPLSSSGSGPGVGGCHLTSQ